jgi:hypothetical protein
MNLKEKALLVKELPMVEDVLRICGIEHHGKKWHCPFHEETIPSLSVWKDGTAYTCFGCDAKGSAIDLVMHFYDVEYKQAVEMLFDGLKHPGWTTEVIERMVRRDIGRRANHNIRCCRIVWGAAIDCAGWTRMNRSEFCDEVERLLQHMDVRLEWADDAEPDVPPNAYTGLVRAACDLRWLGRNY